MPIPDKSDTASATTAAPVVSVLVVAYNAGEFVRRCLESLAGPGRPTVPYEVLVLDNASDPPLAPLLHEHLPPEQVLTLPENVGFARGCNLLAERARGRHLLLLNPDAEVRAGTVDALVSAVEHEPRAGVVGGRTVEPDGAVDPTSCWGAPSLWSLLCFATGLSAAFSRNPVLDPESLGRWPRDTVRDVGVVTGCLLLAPAELWREVGGFDPDFFMYGEDADLCRRVRDSGRRVWITPRAVAVHAGGASSTSADKMVMLMKGRVTYLRKGFGSRSRPVALALLRAGAAVRAGGYRLAGRAGNPWVAGWSRRQEWWHGYGPAPVRQAA